MQASTLRQALWAPATVVAVALVLGRLPAIDALWSLLHVLGGAALAHCFIRLREDYLLAFALACTGALAWELSEFGIDQFLGTDLQEGRVDTTSDLALGVCGAALYLSFAALAAWRARAGR